MRLIFLDIDGVLLQFGHGGEAVEDASSTGWPTGWPSFNSATAVKPWKTLCPTSVIYVGVTLQFGHGGEAVEDHAAPVSPGTLNQLQFGHGGEAVEDPPGLALARKQDAGLQFGHGGEAVEDAPFGMKVDPCSSFNSATAVKPWKTP